MSCREGSLRHLDALCCLRPHQCRMALSLCGSVSVAGGSIARLNTLDMKTPKQVILPPVPSA